MMMMMRRRRRRRRRRRKKKKKKKKWGGGWHLSVSFLFIDFSPIEVSKSSNTSTTMQDPSTLLFVFVYLFAASFSVCFFFCSLFVSSAEAQLSLEEQRRESLAGHKYNKPQQLQRPGSAKSSPQAAAAALWLPLCWPALPLLSLLAHSRPLLLPPPPHLAFLHLPPLLPLSSSHLHLHLLSQPPPPPPPPPWMLSLLSHQHHHPRPRPILLLYFHP